MPSFYEVRADTEMSASNYDRRPDDDDLYYSGDEETYSTVGVDQTHSDDPVRRNGESHDDVRASDNEVQEIWIRRAKGRVSSTTTKFVRSCILRGNTASSRATVSFLPVKSKSVVPRKIDYMTVPDLTPFIKKDQNVQKDLSRFDFTPAKLVKENNDKLQVDVSESSTESRRDGEVPFPRSNSAREIRQIDTNQSAGSVSSQSATPLIDQSEPRIGAITVQSEAARAGPDYYKNLCRRQFAITAISETDDASASEISSSSRSNSIDFVENSARPHSSSFFERVTSNLPWPVQGNRRILRRKTRPRKHQIYRLIRALYVVTSLCSSPIIAVICCYVMELLGMVSLWSIRALMLGTANTSENPGLHSSDDQPESAPPRTLSPITQFDKVELQHRTSTDSSLRTRLQVRQQCRTPSTRHVVATQPFPEFNNVELHRQPTLCMPSPAMSNSIDKSCCHHNGASVQQCRTPSTVVKSSQQCRTPSTIQADPSCVQS